MRITRRTFLRCVGLSPILALPAAVAAEESTMAGRYDLLVRQGESFRREIAWRDEAGTLIVLTGYTARAMIRADVDDAASVLTLTTENSRIALGSFGSGAWVWNITLSATPATTAALADWGDGVWDLELVSAGGTVTRLLEGQAVLSKEASR